MLLILSILNIFVESLKNGAITSTDWISVVIESPRRVGINISSYDRGGFKEGIGAYDIWSDLGIGSPCKVQIIITRNKRAPPPLRGALYNK